MSRVHARAMPHARGWSAAEYQDLLGSPGVFAVGDDTGFALGRAIVDEAELLMLCVDPGHWRRGLGQRWLAAYEAEARLRGAALSHLEVDAGNAAAIALYRSAGYLQSGRRRGYYTGPDGHAADAILFRKSLSAA